jgi:hypothetical protein
MMFFFVKNIDWWEAALRLRSATARFAIEVLDWWEARFGYAQRPRVLPVRPIPRVERLLAPQRKI